MSLSRSSLIACLVLVAGCKEAAPPARLTTVAQEAAGMNCPSGGLALLSGVDANADGVISASEATSTNYVCNAAASSLVRVVDEPAGDNCEYGGSRIVTGPDTNGNGTLDASEGTSTQYICGGAQSLMSRSVAGPANETCSGGLIRLAFGLDADADGTLQAAEEQTVFVTCNLAPSITRPRVILASGCAQSIVLPITFSDLDGTVESVTARLLASGSSIAVSVDSMNRVVIAPGTHVAGAAIEVTVTDDLGARTTSEVNLSFTGADCVPDQSFHGVDPASCVGVDVDALAGDDRSGPVIGARGVYYNGDSALVRVSVDARGQLRTEILAGRTVDSLMGDDAKGELLSLWSAAWTADGGMLSNGLLSTPLATWADGATFDEIAVIDEVSFQPTRRVTLPTQVASSFMATDAMMVARTFTTNRVLVAAADGHALVALSGSDSTDTAVRYLLVDTTTGMTVIDRSVVQPVLTDHDWQDQEDDVQHYALTRRGTAFWLTYLAQSGGWHDLELQAGSPLPVTTSFANSCDMQNLALTGDGRQAWFHSESSCFGIGSSETVIRCRTLYTANDGGIDDSGEGQIGQ